MRPYADKKREDTFLLAVGCIGALTADVKPASAPLNASRCVAGPNASGGLVAPARDSCGPAPHKHRWEGGQVTSGCFCGFQQSSQGAR